MVSLGPTSCFLELELQHVAFNMSLYLHHHGPSGGHDHLWRFVPWRAGWNCASWVCCQVGRPDWLHPQVSRRRFANAGWVIFQSHWGRVVALGCWLWHIYHHLLNYKLKVGNSAVRCSDPPPEYTGFLYKEHMSRCLK